MRTVTFSTLLALLSALVGCGSPPSQDWRPSEKERLARKMFIQSHPEFPPELVEQLRRFETTPEDALRRHEYVDGRVGLPPALRRLILYGAARVGMHEDHVRAALGEPDSVTERGPTGQTWAYTVASRAGNLRELEVVLEQRWVIAVSQL